MTSQTVGIHIPDDDTCYGIAGRNFTGAQLCNAIGVVFGIAQVYADSAAANGGGSHIDWESFDSIAESADAVLVNYMDEVNEDAKRNNGFEGEDEDEDDPRDITLPDGTVRHNVGSDNLSDEDRAAATADMNAWLAERKKADDTEGGACD
jgi:hypothetical protein